MFDLDMLEDYLDEYECDECGSTHEMCQCE